ncbi:MAG: helix-turn-helix transcriptional regulator [Chloroflexi bacterium]|nr:helix-turn-helix transcriptional regulator [Chloroflexota bacterium]
MSKLRELRLKMQLSQPKLAVTAKVHPATIYNVEVGKTKPSLNTRIKLAKALCVEQSDIE